MGTCAWVDRTAHPHNSDAGLHELIGKELDMDFDKMVEKEPDPEAPAEPLRSLGTKPVNIMLDVAFAGYKQDLWKLAEVTYAPRSGWPLQ
ncbi:hypothetical protein NQZ68_010594 [Dissostichus eleginoides]|nr:hypothetical protein NQZ68_010594 [Dissostichus eleginoides]